MRLNAMIPVMLAAALPFVSVQAAAQTPVAATGPRVDLSISEEVRGAPDIATLSTGVTSRAMTAGEALRANSAQMDRLIAKIKAMGVAAKDIQTSGININAQYDYRDNQRVFLGYDVSNNLNVIVRDLPKLGSMIDAMVEAGANNLSGPWFGMANDEPLKQVARERALDRANALARYYAQKAGYKNVRLLSVSEGVSGVSPPVPMPVRAMAESAKAAIEPGQIGLSVNLSVSYEMVN